MHRGQSGDVGAVHLAAARRAAFDHRRDHRPAAFLVLVLGPDEVSISPSDQVGDPDIVLPAEALVRLVYGRLDPDHTPQVRGTADLDELRRIFPGA